MKSLRRRVDLISLSASAENFTIRQDYFIFSQENISLNLNPLSTLVPKTKFMPDRYELCFLFPAEFNGAFYMICVREHINGADFFDFIAFFDEHIEVSCKGFGIA